GSYYGATPNDLTCTAWYAYTTGLMAKISSVLGLAEDQQHYQTLHEEIVRTFQSTFFTADGRMTAQTQTAHVLALHFHLVPEKWRARTLAELKHLLELQGGHLVTGFVGTPYIAHALSDNGALDEAYALLLKRDFPSWLYEVEKGATTIWEHWDGIKPDGSMWSADMNSMNHYAYGAIGEWMYKAIGGIRADENEPGYHHAIIAPKIGGALDHAQASLQTVYGLLSVRWARQGNNVTVEVRVPCNTHATVLLEGTLSPDAAPTPLHAESASLLKAEIGSGTYHFVYQIVFIA
ncbi:MAG: alpha-L-rhamnosidase C-terminal domain-containing protein, partial [Eubacteriales bacterium]|nr:alpha-L-rhamnosidase C-terminal domain-containing protein [Eubacteriales bacterium]